MKKSIMILLSLITAALSTQGQGVYSCFNDEMADNIRDEIYVVLNESYIGTGDSSFMREYFSALDFSVYHIAFSFFKDLGIRCGQIQEYSILECYESHEPFRYIYLVVKDIEGNYYVSKYDCSLSKGEYLGDMRRNYFSKMFEYISISPTCQSKGTNYMLLIRFTNEKVLKVELEVGVTIWTMNQLFLLENALFDDKSSVKN